ncbi:MAG: GDP-mannose 4,6-dehydratase [Sphingomonadaceae bacterium]|nr:GDP-mannose 4,6-dehydratase [Sphingomonadaceae bacterium]
MSGKCALISGISGQDGAWLAQLLLTKGYRVYGTSRDADLARFGNLQRLGIRDQVTCLSLQQTDFRSVLHVLEQVEPDEIYNLAGQSSVGLSFEQPLETLESIAYGTLNLLEALRFTKSRAKLYNAASSECFGETSAENPADERSSFAPRSPYGIAKATAFWSVANYRDAYGLNAASGILFNHESPLRPERFVTRKVVKAACAIAAGSDQKLHLGDLGVVRDWGWAPEYVDAMWRMLQAEQPRDYVIATGRSHSLEQFVAAVFAAVGRDWRDHVESDPRLRRATDLRASHADPNRAARELGWQATTDFATMVERLVCAEQSGRD